jgi:hypothetical protein
VEKLRVALLDRYNKDGMNYPTRKPSEILTEISLGSSEG